MSTLKLMALRGAFALLLAVAAGGLRPTPARAERKEAPLNLALAPPTAAPRPAALAATPPATDEDDAPTTAASPAPKTVWWPWVLIAVAAGGVGALVFTSSGKDPSCPAGRTCK